MSKKIIIYNSFAHDGHLQLLRRQLVEVNKELLTCRATDKKALINERRLLQRKLRGTDATPKSFWSYQASGETPSLAEAIELKAISAKTTQVEWDRLSPGMKREIVRSKKPKDGVGTPEEQAYGEGFHSQLRSSPYSEAELTKAWENGKKAAELKNKLRKNSFYQGPQAAGMKRKVSFDPPKIRQDSRDFKSERGYVAKIINTAKGSTLARSEPMISEASARKWAAEQAPKFRTMRTKAELEMVFYDPDRM
jgi:hypothetical protein